MKLFSKRPAFDSKAGVDQLGFPGGCTPGLLLLTEGKDFKVTVPKAWADLNAVLFGAPNYCGGFIPVTPFSDSISGKIYLTYVGSYLVV